MTGPGTYNAAAKQDGNGVMKAPIGDRYAVLQRKLEDLERVHEDGKREVRTALDLTTCSLNQTCPFSIRRTSNA